MTLEEFEMLTDEQKQQALDYTEEMKPRIIKCKCKPTYNFQSIEFEWNLDLDNDDDKVEMMELYLELCDFLETNCPEQPEKKSTKKATEFVPPSEKQIALMKRHKIPYNNNTSMAEARTLIKDYFDYAQN